MRRFTFLVLLSSVAACAPINTKAQDFKVGIVDMKEIFAEFSKSTQQIDRLEATYASLIIKWEEMQRMITDPAINEVQREQKQKDATVIADEAKILEREIAEFRARRAQLPVQILGEKDVIVIDRDGIDDPNAPRRQIEDLMRTNPGFYYSIPEVQRFLKKAKSDERAFIGIHHIRDASSRSSAPTASM